MLERSLRGHAAGIVDQRERRPPAGPLGPRPARWTMGPDRRSRLDPSPAPLVPFLLGLAVTAGITVPSLLRLRARSTRASLELAAEQERSAILEQMTGHLGQELRFLTEFVNDYPRLARELYSGVSERQVPAALLDIVQRSLDPQRVAVLVRRSEPRGETAHSPRLVVAAAYPDGAAIDVGSDVPLDRGAIGFAAEAQRVIDREDLDKEAAGRVEPGAALPGIPSPDFIAPLVFDQDTLGMILVQHPRRSGDAKTVLRLIAQSGAQVLHTATQVGRMKQTAEMDGLTRIHNKKHLEQVLNDLVYRAACAAYDRRAAGQPQPPPPGLGVPVRHRQLQALQRHQRPPRRGRAAARPGGPGHAVGAQGRRVRPLRGRGVPAGAAEHRRGAGDDGGREGARADRGAPVPVRASASRSAGSASAGASPSTRTTASTRPASCTPPTRRSTRRSVPAATACSGPRRCPSPPAKSPVEPLPADGTARRVRSPSRRSWRSWCSLPGPSARSGASRWPWWSG